MRYVLDASVAIKWVLPENDSGKAIELQEAADQAVHDLLVPETFPVEVAHALTRAERKGFLKAGEAIGRLTQILATSLEFHAYLPLLPRAVELSTTKRIGVYDCIYVALAEEQQCALVTADDRLLNSMQGFPIVSLSAL